MEAQSYPTGVSQARDSPTGGHLLARPGSLDPITLAVFAVGVSAAGAARPSLWFDEAATISAATRTVPELWRLLGNVDAVHGLYYLLMHGWFAVFPATEFWSRLPSCLAVGVATAGVVVLGRRLSSRTVALSAGIVFAILPRVTWAGVEARSYAVSTACAVWLTVLVVAGARRHRRWCWPAYAVGLILATLVNVFVLLIALPHAFIVIRAARRRSTMVWWFGWCAAAVAAVTPFIEFTRTQIAQVRWISPPDGHTPLEIVYDQYFDLSAAFAVTAGLIVVYTVVSQRLSTLDADTRLLASMSVAWMVLPTAVLVIHSLLAQPVYYPRYLCFTSPAIALLLAVCVTVVGRRHDRIVALLAVLAIAATPNYLFKQRGPYAKEGMDFSQIADLLTARASPGDCLVLDNTVTWLPGPVRPLTAARPQAFDRLIDPGRGMPAADRNWLWDQHIAIWAVADRLRECAVLWTVTDRDPSLSPHEEGVRLDPGPRMGRSPAYQVADGRGFDIVERWQFNFAQVTRSTR